jgi:hypothetical protein
MCGVRRSGLLKGHKEHVVEYWRQRPKEAADLIRRAKEVGIIS